MVHMKIKLALLFCFISGTASAALKPLKLDEINSYQSGSLKFTAITGAASLPSGKPIELELTLEITDKKTDPSGKLLSAVARFSVFQKWADGDIYEDQFARVHCKVFNPGLLVREKLASEGVEDYELGGITVILPSANLLGPSPVSCTSFEKIEVTR